MPTPDVPKFATQIITSFESGNAANDGTPFKGWFIGHFVPAEFGARATDDVEIKWGVHEPGEGQDEWTVNRAATSISILVRGKDKIIFLDGDVTLEREGDYVIWGPGIPHKWRALEESVVLSVRWPSLSEDSIALDEKNARDHLSHAMSRTFAGRSTRAEVCLLKGLDCA